MNANLFKTMMQIQIEASNHNYETIHAEWADTLFQHVYPVPQHHAIAHSVFGILIQAEQMLSVEFAPCHTETMMEQLNELVAETKPEYKGQVTYTAASMISYFPSVTARLAEDAIYTTLKV